MSDPEVWAHRSLIFYDNAGEHFEPGIANEESPGTLHVASSSGIFFFLTSSPEFRSSAWSRGSSVLYGWEW